MASRQGTIRSGLGFLAVGLLISVGSYILAASSGAGRYYVATGAFVFGVIRLLQGLAMPPDRAPDRAPDGQPDGAPYRAPDRARSSEGPGSAPLAAEDSDTSDPVQARRRRRAQLLGLKR